MGTTAGQQHLPKPLQWHQQSIESQVLTGQNEPTSWSKLTHTQSSPCH